MKNAGIGLPENSPEKKQFNEISERLSQLSLTFNNNVLDGTKAYKRVVKDKAELEGCSEAFLATLKANGERLGEDGYCITLDYPIYGPFMMNCSNRALREEVKERKKEGKKQQTNSKLTHGRLLRYIEPILPRPRLQS